MDGLTFIIALTRCMSSAHCSLVIVRSEKPNQMGPGGKY